MHGDIRNPSDAVITKDDYETYNHNRPLFTTALQGDLVSKTFLFIGFSFEDPNLEYILSRIKFLLGENTRTHYCFLKKINENDYANRDDYIYAEVKQELKVKDLQRYGIEAVLLDNYDQITDILQDLEFKYKMSNIFISGSAEEYGSKWSKEDAIKFMHFLSKKLVKEDYKVVSGFGIGVGSYIINGALEEIMTSKYNHIDEHLCLRPFPQFESGDKPLRELWVNYRQEMIELSGICIFMFGNKKDGNNIVLADGVIREFDISKEQGKYLIPIGSTGYAAKHIFDYIKNNIKEYAYLEKYLDELENETDIDKLISVIFDIIKTIKEDY